MAPVLLNNDNHYQWPHVMSQDLMRHVHALKSSVFMMSGQVKGKTLLPLPAGSERIEQAAFEREMRCCIFKCVIFIYCQSELWDRFDLTAQYSFIWNFFN